MKRFLPILGVILAHGLIFTGPAAAFTRSGFDNPESFVVDPETGAYYVSNVAGSPSAKDGNGYISKISANGNVVIRKFVGGGAAEPFLNAPKGLVVRGAELWTADIDVVRVFDKETGKLLRVIDCSTLNARFLNDICLDLGGRVYVSDMLGDQILMIDPSKNYAISIFYSGAELGNPNGILFNPKTRSLMVATFKSGEILEIDRLSRIHRLKRGLKTLDGIDYDAGGNLYVASFEKGEIYKIPFYGRGPLTVFRSGLTTPADITCDRKSGELLIPSMKGNTIVTVFLKTGGEKPRKTD